MNYNLTEGNITKNLLKFAFPLMLGNLLQQLYNVADTVIVGKFLGVDALAAVGSSYTFMVFLTSILLGLCMGSSAFFSIQFGKGNLDRLKNSFFLSFILIGSITILLIVFVYFNIDWIIGILQIPSDIVGLMKSYIFYVFMGIFATFLYNYFANVLRAMGNSFVPLVFLAFSALLNITLDLVFVLVFHWGVAGAAIATVISQYIAGIGIMLYFYIFFPNLRMQKHHMRWDLSILKEFGRLSILTCIQQSIMNLGILMVQGLINSFGTIVMAAFTAAVKIDSFAYMPVQDFGNAFSTYIGQNFGAGKMIRIQKGIKCALLFVFTFSSIISLLVCVFARPLMCIFIDPVHTDIIDVGVKYLRIEAVFYFAIGLLFLFYGFYRAVNKPGISVVLTIISLGSRVLLAYLLSSIPIIGTTGIWVSVPIGWLLADLAGIIYFIKYKRNF